MADLILDGFAGPGGWSVGLNLLGLHDVGLEWDAAACDTRRAAGHRTIRCDVSKMSLAHLKGRVIGVIMSPPCQDFSVAAADHARGIQGLRGKLVWEVLRFVDELRPAWVACEQVPNVLPIWKEFAHHMSEAWGYNTWTGVLNAADFGVPQIRRRAILMARTSRFRAPQPTHSANPSDDIFSSGLMPHVTMAEGLGWTGVVGFPRKDDTGESPHEYRERDFFSVDGPAPALTSKVRSWKRYPTGLNTGRDWQKDGTREDAQTIPTDQPAPTLDTKSDRMLWVDGDGKIMLRGGMWASNNRLFDPETEPSPTVAFGHDSAGWAWVRPSTAICGDARISPPGYRGAPRDYDEDGEYIGERSMDNAVRVTVPEAALLQSFPEDYPFQGTQTKQHEQVGNAVPPLLAQAILRELV